MHVTVSSSYSLYEIVDMVRIPTLFTDVIKYAALSNPLFVVPVFTQTPAIG